MPLGFDKDLHVINLNDYAELTVPLYDDQDNQIGADDLAGVEFTVQDPSLAKTMQAGLVNPDGSGYLRYTNTSLVGEYITMATFSFVDGRRESARYDFQVIDPFNPPVPDPQHVIGGMVWAKLEDCFDVEDEGPWLRDMTNNYFNKNKMALGYFINDALFDINQQNPPTHLLINQFVNTATGLSTPDAPLLAQGTFLVVLRHLIASYTEQPQPMGANVVYEDRRDYPMRWKFTYDIEKETYMRWIALWKRQFLGLGYSKMLIDAKAGRLVPAPMRARSIGRGYW